MNSQRRSAAAAGAKTARACESCISRRARWYCMADNAFLCQSCDDSVHSANPLASRHERVRLKTTSSSYGENLQREPLPAWLCGFRRKARTPRRYRARPSQSTVAVPDLAGDRHSEQHQLLHRVPIYDPNICSSSSSLASNPKPARTRVTDISGFLPDEDMDDFSIESLLGHGHDEDIFSMAELGLLEKTQDLKGCCFEGGRVKQEENDVDVLELCQVDHEMDVPWRTLDLNFDYESPTLGLEGGEEAEEEEQKVALSSYAVEAKGISLRLDYKSVIAGWACQGLPWVTGDRPSDFNLDNAWPDCIGSYPAPVENMHLYSVTGARGAVDGDREREARVSRYREKRQNRLFSKKIRYEVRKLNAEKRPRMKGRFVKRPPSLDKSTFSF